MNNKGTKLSKRDRREPTKRDGDFVKADMEEIAGPNTSRPNQKFFTLKDGNFVRKASKSPDRKQTGKAFV